VYFTCSQVGTITPETAQQNAIQIKLSPGIAKTLFLCSYVSKWNLLPSDVVVNALNSTVDFKKHWSSKEFRYNYKAKSES